jgi:hypothetical protein
VLSVYPQPEEKKGIECSWDQLTLGVNSQRFYPQIVEDFWQTVIPALQRARSVDLKDPKDKAWFHLRRTTHPNKGSPSQYALFRIEILRLKRGFVTIKVQEKIRLLSSKYSDVICAGWWPLNFTGRHDNAFLSFLQKLSVLRGRDGILYDRSLANISNHYDKCPYCQEAYQVMMAADSPWSEPLTPWFEYMTAIDMDKYRTHEYAHWFGHILSGWS